MWAFSISNQIQQTNQYICNYRDSFLQYPLYNMCLVAFQVFFTHIIPPHIRFSIVVQRDRVRRSDRFLQLFVGAGRDWSCDRCAFYTYLVKLGQIFVVCCIWCTVLGLWSCARFDRPSVKWIKKNCIFGLPFFFTKSTLILVSCWFAYSYSLLSKMYYN